MKRILLLLLCLSMLVISSQAVATTITLSSHSALTGATLIDFENATVDQYGHVSSYEVPITSDTTITIGNTVTDHGITGNYINLTGQVMTFDFTELSTTVDAFGFNLAVTPNDNTANWALTAKNGSDGVIEQIAQMGLYSYDFIGIAASNISVVTLETNGTVDITIDNFYFKVSDPAPEPTTMILFGFGLLGVAGISRRKK